MVKNFFRCHKIPLLLVFIACLLYASFAYDLERSDFVKLLSLYTALFFISWKIIQIEKNNFWLLAGIALLFRLVFLGALPNLSQDFYRFIWDGRLLVAGLNPYLFIPEELMSAGNVPIAQAEELYRGMGELSAGHYTNYPPLNQLIFTLTGLLFGKSIIGSVIFMRFIIIAAEFGILYFGKKLLEKFHLPTHRIFWFILNPFIIIELTGNLHFEGVMLFFLILAIYLLHRHKWILSAIMLAFSVLLKLVPLMLLPLFFRYFVTGRAGGETENTGQNVFRLLGFYALVGFLVLLGFLPFVNLDFIANFAESIGLWFQKFEFNASIYYLVRWIGFEIKGYNIIETAGKVLPVVIITIIAGLALFRKNSSTQQLMTTMLLGVSVYFFLSTTVHPWYIATPLLLSIFTRYRFAIAWSFMVIFSYHAYSVPDFKENLWLVALEYLVVLGVFIAEIVNRKKQALFLSN